MLKSVLVVMMIGLIMVSCSTQPENPLLTTWDTPYGVPPFEQVEEQHFLPAFKEAMNEQKAEIEAIVNNSEAPTFENTIAALDYSGERLQRIELLFYNLNSANTNDTIQDIAKEVSPLRSKHYDDINLNPQLFERVKAVYEQNDDLDLSVEQQTLLEDTYKSFVRNGANLPDAEKEELRKINEQLSMLTLNFGQNVLAETNDFILVIEDSADLVGLPQWLIDQAAEAAEENDKPGAWVFTLHKPSWIPFLQYSPKRDLREQLYTAWMHIGDNNNEHDNKDIIKDIVSLRVQRANLLGYDSHADYVLENNMAKNAENVFNLLDQLWTPALNRAKAEAYDMQNLIDSSDEAFDLASWDWWYYAEKIRQQKFDLSDDMLKPYFELENVKQGVFDVAKNLFGLTFDVLPDVPVYHDDVMVYQVKDRDGSHQALLYMDFHPRASKRSGAWMTEFRNQYYKDGENITPIVSIVMNFSKPTAELPSLLTLDEVLTFFHEFGHALHLILSDVTYPSQAGTNVRRDFVELPSQIMENWAVEPEVIKSYAKHYETGEPIQIGRASCRERVCHRV